MFRLPRTRDPSVGLESPRPLRPNAQEDASASPEKGIKPSVVSVSASTPRTTSSHAVQTTYSKAGDSEHSRQAHTSAAVGTGGEVAPSQTNHHLVSVSSVSHSLRPDSAIVSRPLPTTKPGATFLQLVFSFELGPEFFADSKFVKDIFLHGQQLAVGLILRVELDIDSKLGFRFLQFGFSFELGWEFSADSKFVKDIFRHGQQLAFGLFDLSLVLKPDHLHALECGLGSFRIIQALDLQVLSFPCFICNTDNDESSLVIGIIEILFGSNSSNTYIHT
ncbi:hypothetical protein C8R44DRAFT_864123 [Mycena epipterygia]|nr:hypothetical protein C8R44DRAFT_864123 [Mycena epipterygia]